MTTKKPGSKKPTKQQADDQRFNATDQVMESGGYARAGAAKSSASKKSGAAQAQNADKTYPTSWHATQADRIRINQLQGWMMMQGYRPSKTQVMQLALRCLENTDEQQFKALYDAMTAEQHNSEG